MMRNMLRAQKRVLGLFPVLFFPLFFSGLAQEIIENPKKPLNENAGRILRLEKQMTITDETGEFFLEYPSRLKVSGEGSIFLYDREQLIQLDREGRFIRNFYRKGQGPGELSYVSNFLVLEDTLIVHNNSPNKIVWFDLNGKWLKELSLREMGSRAELLFYREGTFFLLKSGMPARTDKMEVMEIPYILTALSEKTHEQKELISFPLKALVMGGAWLSGGRVISVPYEDRYLFVSHTQEYLVHLYDCKARTLLRRFTRAYRRVRRPRNQRSAAIINKGKRYK
ncbi:MAG: 6-bladed beta-propeller, partial [Candidatus Aminicenantales bacterium]